MSPALLTGLLFGTLIICIMAGLPIAFSIGGVGLLFGLLLWGPDGIYIMTSSISGTFKSLILIAVPLFVLMANILEKSGIADELYDMMHIWMGGLRGGLAIGTVIICTVFAAMSGISATATVIMGFIALPAMLKRGYDKSLVMGAIMAGGALGPLIPPSVMMILYAMLTQTSIGMLFFGGFLPGLLLSFMFSAYILIRCLLNKKLGPPLPAEERGGWKERIDSLRAVILPLCIIASVLGGIYLGICTPSEAAAVGATGAIISAAIYRKLHWNMFKDACYRTLGVTAMVLWIVIAAKCFSMVYVGCGGPQLMTDLLTGLPGGRFVPIIAMQVIIFVLGCILDPMGILMVCIPIFLPVAVALGFSPIWFGVLFVMNMEMAFLTPPVGFNLFYMKGVAPKNITIGDIYRSVFPFVSLQAFGLILCMIWPQIIMWLPTSMLRS